MQNSATHSILLEMLRSFVTLAKTLNLSKAVDILGSTRPTIRRHIKALEDERGAPLFDLIDRQYYLTEEGERSLREAQTILDRSEAWLLGSTNHVNGLEIIHHTPQSGQNYFAQQHHLSCLWEKDAPLLQSAFECWSRAKGQIESPEMAAIRPYLLIYRKLGAVWQCVEIGEKSAYARWYGWKWVKSGVGHVIKDTLGGQDSAIHVLAAYHEINATGGVRLDHISRSVPRKRDPDNQDGGELHYINFQRLLIGCTFPDGSTAIGSVVNFTNDIDLPALDGQPVPQMSKDIKAAFAPDG